jgi:hypothetical protein
MVGFPWALPATEKNAASLQLFVYSSGARAHSAASYFDVAFIKKFHETPRERAQKLVLFWRESLEWNRLCLKATSQFIFFAGRNFRRTHLPSRIARHVFRKIILLEGGRLEQNDRTHALTLTHTYDSAFPYSLGASGMF